MPRIAVLGGSGWLGSRLLAELGDAPGVEVISPPRIAVEGATPAGLRSLLSPDESLAVVNCVGVIRGTDEQIDSANLDFVRVLMQSLEGSGAYLVQVGSAAEYGDPGSADPIPETRPTHPVTVYGRSKALATALVHDRSDWCVVRPFNGIDRDMTPINPLGEIREKVRAARESGGEVELWSAATVRDHVSRDFLARSLAWAARERPAGVFNLCSGVGLSYREIAEAMAEISGGRLPIRDLARESGIPAVVGDPSAWRGSSGLSEAMDAEQVAALVMSG